MPRRIVLSVAAVTALLLAYPLAALIGGSMPSNDTWRAPERGITLFLETNGVHTGIIMPKVAGGVDWRPIFPARDLADPRYGAYDHVAVGWGERAFYLETPTWADLKPSTVFAAAFGSDRTLVHVDHLPPPVRDGSVRRLIVTPAQYRRLAAYVRASLVEGGERYRGYFAYDAFYAARGRYDAVDTCNAWVGDALRFAGIRVGAWTPLPVTIMWWFPRYD